MQLYFVKRDLYGVKAGVVEQFHDNRAPAYLKDGSIEPYDEKNKRHRDAPGAPETKKQQREATVTK